jgi:hypothetical protein
MNQHVWKIILLAAIQVAEEVIEKLMNTKGRRK